MQEQPTKEVREEHWKKTKSLMIVALVIWFIFSFLIHGFALAFSEITIPILGFKLGYYMAGQGSLIVFVILIFWFSAKQNAIDEEFGVSE